jgi:dephospho-CoA kinase
MAKVIGIVGMPASGKSVVAEHWGKKGFKIHSGDFLMNYLKRMGVKPTEETSVMASLYMWVEYGDIPVFNWIVRQITKNKRKRFYIVDSLRTVEEARLFRRRYGDNFKVVAIVSSPKDRLKRYSKRARFGATSKLEFRLRDREELRMGVGDLIASADYHLDNSGSVADLKKRSAALLPKVLK